MCWLKEQPDLNAKSNLTKKHLRNPLFASWWANPTHHGFNPGELGSKWDGSKINPYWNL